MTDEIGTLKAKIDMTSHSEVKLWVKNLLKWHYAVGLAVFILLGILTYFHLRNRTPQFIAGSLPKNPRILTISEVEQLLGSDFKIFRRVEEIPSAVKNDYAALTNEPFEMVNPGKSMSTDMIIPGLPNKRLVLLGLATPNAVLIYQRGGYVDTLNAIIISHAPGGGVWMGRLDEFSISSIPALKTVIQSGRFSADEEIEHATSASVPLCELVKNSKKYAGKTITTTTRITAGKHVTGLWDPACSNIGADLWIRESERSSPSILQLDEALRDHGLSDHPVIATLTGTWLGEHYEEHQFLPQPRLILEITDASNIGQSEKVERR